MQLGPRPDREQRAVVAALRTQGLAITEIGRRLNLSRQRVYAILKACGPVARLPRSEFWTPEKDELVAALSDKAAAVRLGCRTGMVRNRRKKLGMQRQDPATTRLSALQEWVLRRSSGRPVLPYSEILEGFFGWAPEPGSSARKHFSLRRIGPQKYKQTLVTVIRSCKLLSRRGLVGRVARAPSTAGGVKLTERGQQWLKENPGNRA